MFSMEREGESAPAAVKRERRGRIASTMDE
jgi:hypothetical protein